MRGGRLAVGDRAPALTLPSAQGPGFFIVECEGIVRYALAGSYFVADGIARGIPGNDDIVRELQRWVVAP